MVVYWWQEIARTSCVKHFSNTLWRYKEKEQEIFMRLRNIPGAQDAILESPYVVQEPQTKKGHWGEVFAKKQPLHIGIGMGKGRFLMDLARLHPDINYIGIEMYDSVLLRALQKREELEENGEVYSNYFL